MADDFRDRGTIEVDLDTHPSDTFNVSDLKTSKESLPEAKQVAEETSPEPEEELSLDDEVALRREFLDKKLAFFSAQSQRLGEYNDDVRNENGAEEALSMVYLKTQRAAIEPLFEAVERLDDARLRLTRLAEVRDQSADLKEKDAATDMIKEIEAGLEQTKQEIADFNIEEFNKNTLAAIEDEQTQIKAELADKQLELREIEGEMKLIKKRLQRKQDEMDVLKARLTILGIEEEEKQKSNQELAAVGESKES